MDRLLLQLALGAGADAVGRAAVPPIKGVVGARPGGVATVSGGSAGPTTHDGRPRALAAEHRPEIVRSGSRTLPRGHQRCIDRFRSESTQFLFVSYENFGELM